MKKIAEKPGDEADYSIINHQRIEEALEKAYKVLSVYNLLEKRNNNRIEIIATDQVLEKDPVSNGIGQLNFLGLKGLSPIAGKYLAISGAESILFFFTVSCRKEGLLSKVYELRRKDSGFALDLLAERDLRNPYNATSDQREANLYRMGKWPMDIWARETFDNGEYEELTIDTIDHNAPGVKEGTRVAASIHIGKINGSTACFYMKDSRINGGATGDLEGLKYLAAVYISYLKGWPLYVWNDGAGANIGEGMVSLNRGAEGFMLNTMSGHMGREDFLKYARGSSDPRLVQLFATIDRQIFSEGFPEDRSYHFITCVGVGSSAGLDVYGSSQAPVQIILDSDQSYRVLTGSAVIKSVMGENITNYDIGGARVMSKWAGIVDLVAADKFRLVSQIRRVHSLFASEEPAPDIRRSRVTGNENEESTHFSESMVISNVDDKNYLPFKQDYYGSGSVVAGFAKMGGRRVAILGPRSADGLRSYASIVRAHDVLRTASRMKISSILILGKRWHQDAELYDGPGVRARMDFVNVLKDHGGLRITVVTDISGFHCLEITSHSDVIVFVRNRDLDAVERDFVERNATFMVSSLDEAFDLGHQLINYGDPLPGKQEEAQGYPDIPTDAGSPYDMIESLIRKIPTVEDSWNSSQR
jgi:hypothetical protein